MSTHEERLQPVDADTHNDKVYDIGKCLLGEVRKLILDESPGSAGDDALGNDWVIAR